MKMRALGEFGLIERIAEISRRESPDLIAGIDDDAAVVDNGNGTCSLITSDSFVESVHFSLDYFTYEEVGWRVMAANLSDIAAMGGVPRFAQVCICLPESTEVEDIRQLYSGVTAIADNHGVIITGGDTTRSPRHLYISITVLGEVKRSDVCLRSGAKPGDAVMVTGDLGSSHAGMLLLRECQAREKDVYLARKHLRPEPRCKEGQFLAGNFPVSAMMDISDGLASDIRHICRMSKCGVKLWGDAISIHPMTKQLADQRQERALDYAIGGGEDFELLFTISPEHIRDIQDGLSKKFGLAVSGVGEITENKKMEIVIDGKTCELPSTGFDHFL
jgi:thiamine-monophosphate kinase